MDDREFFDLLYQQWTRTSGSEDTFWAVEEDRDTWEWEDGEEVKIPGRGWNVWSVDQDDNREFVGNFEKEADADFVAGIHGCLGDLVRRLNDALDEADRADEGRDEREVRIAELELENAELRKEV